MRRYLSAAMIGFGLLSLAAAPAGNGRDLPSFKLKLINGKPFTAESLRGKVGVIDFWGTWCKPCIEEIPQYNAFYKEYSGKGIVFVAIAVESGSEDDVRAAARRLRIQYPVAAATASEVDQFGDVPVFPSTWIVNSRGKIVRELLGTSPKKQKTLREAVDRLLTTR